MDRRAGPPSTRLMIAGLAAIALGFGLGLAVSATDSETKPTVGDAPPSTIFDSDLSTVPHPAPPARTVTVDEVR